MQKKFIAALFAVLTLTLIGCGEEKRKTVATAAPAAAVTKAERGTNVEKAFRQQSEEEQFMAWRAERKVRIAFNAGMMMSARDLQARVDANPKLLAALQGVALQGVAVGFGSDFGVQYGMIFVDWKASDEEIIKFLTN